MKWFTKIKDIATFITSVVAVFGIIWGVFKFVGKTETQGETLSEIKVSIDSLSGQVERLSGQVTDMTGQVEAINENTVLVGRYVEGVKKAFDYHITNSPEVTKDDYRKMIMMIDELKKNEQPIAYK